MPVTGVGLASAPNFPSSSSALSTSTSSASATSSSSTASILPQTSSQAANPINTPSPEAATARSSSSRPVVIGVFAGVAVLLVLLLACLITCLRSHRRERQRQEREMKLDREIDASYSATMKQGAESWHPPAPLNSGMTHSRANSTYSTVSEASGSHPAYAQPPIPVTQQQQNYNAPPQRDDEALTAKLSVAVRGTMVEPQIMQPQQARTHSPPVHAHSVSLHAKRPSQSADILLSEPQPAAQPLPTIYLSHYALSPLPADAASVPYTSPTAEMPITPTSFPNPFELPQEQQRDQGKAKGMRPPSAALLSPGDMPITPTPFPNPFDEPQLHAKQVSPTTPVSPAPTLPNPYASDE
ncbi:hypothetical protein MSAN_01821700 [Mycena sanguinolenta]|uniref:Uncharacterized protein n=1 Tax=Mycena sanguinolenta TaxID=230812 RepID=A0A8H7CSV0_9AGAR|nr:hypothetical protein MSAN_01821700 [Mycena sanguinolenta]